MSIKFSIKNTQSKAEKEGDVFVRYSGVSEPYTKISERTADAIGRSEKGDPILVYTTGLDEKKVKFFRWYNDEEKKSVIKQIEELRPLISEFYGGDEVVSEKNMYFWGVNRDVNRLSLSNENMDVFYDTKNPVHALLYLSVVSGAFIDTVAPTRDWAERHQLPHYLALETDETFAEEDEITRSDAHGALADLRKDASPEALFILAWCVLYDTQAFGGFLRSIAIKDLVNSLIKFIDGKLVSKRKRNTPKIFLEYVAKWKGQQTRPALFIEAYVKAGQYFSFINQKAKKFETMDGTVLGNTVQEAVDNLQKNKYADDFAKLRDQVEAKWKE